MARGAATVPASRSTDAAPAREDARPTTKNPLSSGVRAGVRAGQTVAKPSSLLDTRVVYCGDNLESFFKRSHQVIGVLIRSGKCGSDQ